MTTTRIDRSTFGRARTESVRSAASQVCASTHAPTAVRTMSHAATAFAITATNPWLGGDVHVSGFGSTYATKRIAPDRLEGMT